jgi:hypothetical protein
MLPGLFDYQLKNRKAGKAVFHVVQDRGVMMEPKTVAIE